MLRNHRYFRSTLYDCYRSTKNNHTKSIPTVCRPFVAWQDFSKAATVRVGGVYREDVLVQVRGNGEPTASTTSLGRL